MPQLKFSNIIGKEQFLDIAYLIKVNWTDIDVKWDRSDQARYLYFSRGKGRISINIKNDRQLKPSIYKHYMHNINIKTYLTFYKGRTEDEEDFVILGRPLFKKDSDLKIYNNYLKLKDKKFTNIKSNLYIYLIFA